MELNEYQQRAMGTCMSSCENLAYMLINLQGEVGELSSKVAKLIRKEQLCFMSTEYETFSRDNEAEFFCSDDEKAEAIKAISAECGDVLWQLSGVCSVLGLSLEDVANQNLDKLASRKKRGVIDGNGDNR